MEWRPLPLVRGLRRTNVSHLGPITPCPAGTVGTTHYSTHVQPSLQVDVVITDPLYTLQGTRPMGTLDGDISSK